MSVFWTLVRQLLEGKDPSISITTAAREVIEPWLLGSASSRGSSRPAERTERIRSEILMVAPHFSRHEGVDYDEANCDWLMIPKYPLPEKWRNRWCKLLIVFPEAYPIAPPIGFYLNRKFQLNDGGRDDHLIGAAYYNAPDLKKQGWYWYCVQLQKSWEGGWRPSARYDEPDNLRTFLNMVREVLTND